MIRDIVLFIGILGLDRATKVAIPAFMDLYQSIPIIPSFFSLTYVLNTGGAFGILAGWDSPFRRIFFILASVAALALLAYLYRQAAAGSSGPVRLALTAVAAGALGNLFDRATTGEVVDFLDLYVGSYHWPAFNVADCAITLGAGSLLFLYATGRMDMGEDEGGEG
ncbi:MAG: signal peptidase II [bacterium]|nr:MAG: signal peptidase II [bacterium]